MSGGPHSNPPAGERVLSPFTHGMKRLQATGGQQLPSSPTNLAKTKESPALERAPNPSLSSSTTSRVAGCHSASSVSLRNTDRRTLWRSLTRYARIILPAAVDRTHSPASFFLASRRGQPVPIRTQVEVANAILAHEMPGSYVWLPFPSSTIASRTASSSSAMA